MDDNAIIAVIIMGAGCAAVLVAVVLSAHRTSQTAMETLADLANESRIGMERMFKQHTTSLENLKAIESGPDGMRGVVARSQPRVPTILDDDRGEAADAPLPGRQAFVEVGHGFPPIGDDGVSG